MSEVNVSPILVARGGAVFLAAVLAACGAGSNSVASSADTPAEPPEMREFARLPVEPGQPGGIAVDGDTVYVDTFGFVVRPADGTDNVYAYDLKTGSLREDRENPIKITRRFPVCIMGMSGMALDAAGALYLVDMNSRIVRLNPRTGATSDYATFPTGVAGPIPTMPLDIVFDRDGDAYVSDIGGAPIIWRIPAGGGQAEVWFSDARITGYWSRGAGGLRLDPAGENLYLGVNSNVGNATRGTIFKIPLADPASLSIFHSYANSVEEPPLGAGPLGLAFGTSGRLYVAMPGPSQVSVLRPDGTEERRYTFEYGPQFLALTNRGTLLVTAWGFPSGPWPIYEVAVNDTPAGLNYPVLPE